MKKGLPILIMVVLMSMVLLTACGVNIDVNFMVDGAVYATINTDGKEALSMPANPIKQGYEFDGWFWDDGTWQQPFTANSLLNTPLEESLNVYAKWVEESDYKGTQAGFNTLTKISDTEYALEVANTVGTVTFSSIVEIDPRSSWTVSTDVAGNNVLTSKVASLVPGNNKLYVLVKAQDNTTKQYTITIRRKPMYTVTFDTNGGTAVATQTIEEDSLLTVPTTTKNGYAFVGWNYDFATPITANTNITANWTANQYQVVFNSNGGVGEMTTQSYTYDETQELSENLFSKTGYVFSHWNTESDDSGIDYEDRQEIKNHTATNNAVVILYAIWETRSNVEYTVVHKKQNIANDLYVTDKTETLTGITGESVTPMVEQYTGFVSPSTETANILADGSLEIVYLYNRTVHDIEFDINTNKATVSGKTIYNNIRYGDTIVIPQITAKAGYTFSGWDSSVSLVVNSGATYTANITTNTYTATFKDGSTVIGAKTFNVENLSVIEPAVPTKVGYESKWSEYELGATNVTITAEHTANQYQVVFNSNGGVGEMTTQSYTYDETQELSENLFSKTGYVFSHWNTESDDSGIDYEDRQEIKNHTATNNAVVILYAIWEKVYDLESIALESKEFVYDGQEKSLTIAGVLPVGVFVEYENNGLTDVGTQTVTAKIVDGNGINYKTLQAVLKVNPQEVIGIEFNNVTFVYDGIEKSILISGKLPNGVTVRYENNHKINAGSYQVIAKFNVNNNYKPIADKVATLTIGKATIENISFESATYDYDATPKSLKIGGNIPFLCDVTYQNNNKTSAGNYQVTASFSVTDNYNSIDDKVANLVINKADIQFTAQDKSSIYGEDIKELTYITTGTNYNNEIIPVITKEAGTMASTYIISISAQNSNYNIVLENAEYNISKATYDISNIKFDSKEVIYDSAVHSLTIEGTLPTGVVVSYTNNEGVSASVYNATAVFVGDENNYNPIASKTATLVINKANYDMDSISFEDSTRTYNQQEQTHVVSGTLPVGVTVNYSPNKMTNVGILNVRARFSIEDSVNYNIISDMYAKLIIQKADYDMSKITFDNKVKVYNSSIQSIQISGNLPDGVTVSYTNNDNSEAGIYNITARFSGDVANYNMIPNKSATLQIEKATYNMDNISFMDLYGEYDGNEKEIVISGDLPVGVTVTYTDNKRTVSGSNVAIASFEGDSKNYNNIPDMIANIVIQKATYNMSVVSFSSKTYFYNKSIQALAIEGTLPEGVSVAYSNNTNVNAGEYEVIASFSGDAQNYTSIDDMTATLTISKATLDINPTVVQTEISQTTAITLNSNTDVEGSIALDNNQSLVIGNNQYDWTFTPNDLDNYEIVKGAILISVSAKVEFINVENTYDSQYITKGGYAEETSSVPQKDDSNGYMFTFSHWSETDGGTIFDLANTQINDDTTLYAVYTSSLRDYTITYHLDEMDCVNNNPTTYTVESTTITLSNLAKDGYEFKGWYADSAFTTAIQSIRLGSTGNLDIYAKWVIIDYSITYNLCGGTNSESNLEVFNAQTPLILQEPVKDFYIFDAWYLDKEYTTPITSTAGIYYNINLYAKWIAGDTFNAISTKEDLIAIGYDMTAHYYLTQDIDLLDAEWEPIGDESNPFLGILEGNGYTISNFTSTAKFYNVGLFGVINGTICNLGIIDYTITGTSTNVGGITGKMLGGIIYNVYSTGNVSSTLNNSSAGGLVGLMTDGSITNSYATGTVTSGNASSSSSYFSSYTSAGGLVGRMVDGSITNSYATGTVTSGNASSYYSYSYTSAGGLVGYMADGSITNSYATGTVTSGNASSSASASSYSYYSYTSAGGLVGYMADGSITNSYATGAVTSGNASSYYSYSYTSAGGLVGYMADGSITNSYATGAVTSGNASSSYYSYSSAGGLVGRMVDGSITNSYATGAVTSGDISSSSSSSSSSLAGGLVGRMVDGSITNSYATGAVTSGDISYSSSSSAGGLVGRMEDGSITNSYRFNGQGTNNHGTATTMVNLQSVNFLSNTLLFGEFVSLADTKVNANNVWILENGQFPKLYWQV